MSIVRGVQPKSQTRKAAREGFGLSTKLGLLAASSLLPILAAPVANAQCAAVDGANQPVPLNALTSDSVATCSGTPNNDILVDAPGAGNVTVNITSGTIASGLITSLDGANGQVNVFGGATLNDTILGATGADSLVGLWNANGSNLAVSVDGANSTILHLGGSFSSPLVLLSGENNRFESLAGSTIEAFGATTGHGVLAGGTGSNTYALSGALVARNDGLLITDSGGNDVYYINSTATLSAAGGATTRILDFDGVNDVMAITGTHSLFMDVLGIEELTFNGGAADTLDFRGTGYFTRLNANGGTIGQIEIASLFAADAVLDIASGASVRYGAAVMAPALSQSLAGSGEFWLDGAGVLVTGDNSGFSGTFRLTSLAYVQNNDNAFGTGALINDNGSIFLVGSNVANQISGSGSITAAAGRSQLSGVNTYSGGTLITNADTTLVLTDASAAGTALVSVGSDAFLELDFGAAGGAFSNFVTGDGGVRKSGSGLLTLGNAANDYSGGTTIDAGVLRITDFAALGAGGVIANAGGALMYDYSGSSSQVLSAPPMTGAGQFIKNGSGTIVISNANTWTGGSQILAGRVGLNNGQGLGTGDISVSQNAILGIGGITLANNVSGAGQIVKTANNTAVLSGVNTLTGGIVIEQGAIEVATGTALGSGPVDIFAGAALVVDNAANTTVAAQLQGAGALSKLGAGRAQLTGAGGLTGAVSVHAGTLAVSGTANIGSASVQVDTGAALEITGPAGNSTFSNDVTGAGNLLKTGTSTVDVTGANTYTGGTHILGGALRVTDMTHLGSGPTVVDAGAALDLRITGSASLNSTLSGAGVLRKSGAGSLTLVSNPLTGGLDITQGSVIANSTLALGAGAINVASGATLQMSNATDQTFTNALGGAGTLRKTGTGALTFSNPFAIGSLAVDAGRVRLNTSMTGNANVGTSGTLNGNGTIIGNLTNNGVVAPGNSIGTLNVQGNYTHNANSVLEIEFDGAGNIDLLNVSGTATLNGGTLRFVSVGGVEGSGGTFLQANGGVSGTFANIETVGAQLPLSVIYQPTASIMAPSVLTARPSTFNSQTLAASDTTHAFADSVVDHSTQQTRGKTAWVEAFSASGSRSAAGQTLAYDHDSTGLAMGMQFPVDDRLEAGFALGWSQGDIALGANGGSGDQDALLLSANGGYRFDGVSLGGGVLYATIDQSTRRNVSFSGFSDNVSGETTSQVFGGFVSADSEFGKVGDWTLGGSARASYTSQTQDAYTEAGSSPLRLSLPELTFETLGLQAELNAGTQFDLGGRTALASFALGLRHTAAIDDRALPVTFAVSSASVDLQGDARDHTSPYAGASLAWSVTDSATLTAGYNGRFGEDERHEARVGLSVAF